MKLKHFEKNTEGRDFVVGDVHGCFQFLDEKLKELKFDYNKDRLFSVGDLIDRGPESSKVVEYLDQPWFHPVRGNHEQMLLDAYNDERGWLDIFVSNGGSWWLDCSRKQQDVIAYVIAHLPFAIEVETDNGLIGIVHADVPYNDWSKLKEWTEQDYNTIADKGVKNVLLWDRERIRGANSGVVSGIDKVYVGHTPLNEPIVADNVHYIDTGAVFNGNLTVVQIN